jgi:hypothetical protein
VVEIPEIVDNVAVGSPQIHVEWHGGMVLIEPERAGIDTNMIVFTNRTSYLYEIAAASEPGGMSWLVKEPAPPAPILPPSPTPAQVQKKRDKEFTSLLLTTKNINTKMIKNHKSEIVVRIVQVSHDEEIVSPIVESSTAVHPDSVRIGLPPFFKENRREESLSHHPHSGESQPAGSG